MTTRTPHVLHDIPIGIDAAGQRHETYAMGGIDVPADRYGGGIFDIVGANGNDGDHPSSECPRATPAGS